MSSRKLMVIGILTLSISGVAPLLGGDLDPATRDAMVQALEDERRSQAIYDAVLDRFGEKRPFSNVVHAEVRHQSHLLDLFEKYEVEVPANRWVAEEVKLPETLRQACDEAVQAEIENAGLYDTLLEGVTEPDIRQVFTRLREASRERHLPAFQRCAAGKGGGQGHGHGKGKGHGKGRGGQGAGCGGGCGGGCGANRN